jgi:replicative DNA helicase
VSGESESRIPPHDIAAEAAVLSAILVDPRAMPRIRAILCPEDFYSEAHRCLYAACESLTERSMPTDPVTVMTELRSLERLAQVGGPAYVTQILDAAPATANVVAYAKTVRVKSRMRATIYAAQRIAAEGYVGHGPDRDYLARAHDLMADATRLSDADVLEKNAGSLSELVKRIQRAGATGSMIVGLPTGLDAYDRMTLGLQGEKLWIVAARPGKGKSALGGTVALNVAKKNIGVLVFSLEMGKEEWLERSLSAEARIDGTRLKRGDLRGPDWTRLMSACSTLSEIPLFIEDRTTVTVREMRSRALGAMEQAAKMGTALGLVVVDYLQKCSVPEMDRKKGRYEQVGDMAKGMKDMARETKLPIFCLAQLRRAKDKSSAKNPPSMDDLRESGDIEQEADVITLIHETEGQGRELLIEKARGGRVGKVDVGWRPELTLFENGPEERHPS